MDICDVCGAEVPDQEIGKLRESGSQITRCYGCLEHERALERLSFMADKLASGDDLVFLGKATDIVPVGNYVFNIEFSLNSSGFGFAYPDEPEKGRDFFEWGTQKYFGPKSFNKKQSLENYRDFLVTSTFQDDSRRAQVEAPDDLGEHDPQTQLHLAFVVTFGLDDTSTVDRWIAVEAEPVGFEPSIPSAPKTWRFPIFELNRLMKDLWYKGWTDQNGEPLNSAFATADYLKGRAAILQTLSPAAYWLYASKATEYEANVEQIDLLVEQMVEDMKSMRWGADSSSEPEGGHRGVRIIFRD